MHLRIAFYLYESAGPLSLRALKDAIADAPNKIAGSNPTFFVKPAEKLAPTRRVTMRIALRDVVSSLAETSLVRAAELDQIAWDPDSRIERGEEVLLVPSDRVNSESEIYDIVENLQNFDALDARELTEIPTRMYGIAFGTVAEDRILFIRLKRVDSIAAGGGLLLNPAGNALTTTKTPGLVIDRSFDLIVLPEGVAAFDHRSFESLIRDPADVAAELKTNADKLAADVPFAPGIIDLIVARGAKRPMIGRKLRAIAERGHLSGVKVSEIRTALKEQGKDSKDYVKQNVLNFDIDEMPFLLRFLDEGTWKEWKTKKLYAAGGRSAVD